jgi:hypothetical protein
VNGKKPLFINLKKRKMFKMKEKEYENCLDLVNIKKKSKKEKLAFLLDDEISIEEQIESSDKWEDH